MALQTTGLGGLSVEMKTYYDRRLLMRAVPMLFFDTFAQKRSIPKRGGKTIEFRKFATLGVATTALTEGTPPALQDLTASSITATVIQQGGAVGFSDLVSTTTIDPVLDETVDLLAEQYSETIDQLIRDVLVAGTTVQYAGASAGRQSISVSENFVVSEIRTAKLTLEINRARKINGFYHCIIHPRSAFDLQATAEWISANQYAQSGRQFDGSLGELYGVKFWVTDKAPFFADAGNGAGAGGTIDIYAALMFGADAYGIVALDGHNIETIYKPLGSAGTADPLNQQQSMGWKCTFTTKILDQTWMVRIEHSTSTGAN